MYAGPVGIAAMLAAGAIAAGQSQEAVQSPAPSTSTFVSAEDVKRLISRAREERKDAAPLVSEPMLRLGTYDGHLEYRASVGGAALHEREAELFYVIQGSGTLITGGKLVNEKRANATNRNGSAIEGGDARSVAQGDFILVPENTPHWFQTIRQTLVLFSIHVPR